MSQCRKYSLLQEGFSKVYFTWNCIIIVNHVQICSVFNAKMNHILFLKVQKQKKIQIRKKIEFKFFDMSWSSISTNFACLTNSSLI